MLSVATAPVDARQRVVAMTVIFVLTAVCLSLLPLAATALPVSQVALPFLLGIALASDLVTAYLLFSQFLASRLLSTAFLGGAYLVGGAGVLAYLVTFPGVFGTAFAPQAAPLLWVWWHCTFPVAVIVALYFDREKTYTREKHTARLWAGAIALGALALGVVPAVAIVLRGSALPALMNGDSFAKFWQSGVGEGIVILNLLALTLAILWTQGRTVLHTWLIVALVASALDVQFSLASTARFTLGWYLARVLVVVSSTSVLYAYLRQMHVLFARLSDISMIDGLTEIANRRYFEMRLHAAVRGAMRHDRPLALVMTDVDNFKQFNDTYGHLAGDETLKAVASSMRVSSKRPGDVVARWGGEEFVIILPETDREGAYLVAERVRSAVAGLAIPHRNTTVPGQIVTISVGVSVLGGRDDSAAALLERADAALYRAKDTGRNTIAIELPPMPRPAPAPSLLEDVLLDDLGLEGA